MDSIFVGKNYRNDIVWRRAISHNDPKCFGRIADHILFYSKGKSFCWNGTSALPKKTEKEIRKFYPKKR